MLVSPPTHTYKALYQPVTPSTHLPASQWLQLYEPCLLLLLVFSQLPAIAFWHIGGSCSACGILSKGCLTPCPSTEHH